MRVYDKVKRMLYMDQFVSKYMADDIKRNQQGMALIAAAAFSVMSLLNIKQKSFLMLATTGISALFLIVGYIVSKYRNKLAFLQGVFYMIFLVIFTTYTLEGGNDGFAALWLIIATYAVMLEIDFKVGFLISTYYLVMLLLVFEGPLSGLLQYDYNETFQLRFPFLYAINFAFATYIVLCVRTYQYKMLVNQHELERLSTTDLSTGLLNRNYFIRYQQTFSGEGVDTMGAVFIDVNGLHELNNREGHTAGDKMLYIISQLCKEKFPGRAVYRMGGDEFLVLCENVKEEDILRDARILFDAVQDAGYSISYGVEVQEGGIDLDNLVKDADNKMIQFKKEYYRTIGGQKR